mgnify:CR=1 FL=1
MVPPPVCFAAFTAASIAGAHLMKTGVVAFRIALAGQFVRDDSPVWHKTDKQAHLRFAFQF